MTHLPPLLNAAAAASMVPVAIFVWRWIFASLQSPATSHLLGMCHELCDRCERERRMQRERRHHAELRRRWAR